MRKSVIKYFRKAGRNKLSKGAITSVSIGSQPLKRSCNRVQFFRKGPAIEECPIHSEGPQFTGGSKPFRRGQAIQEGLYFRRNPANQEWHTHSGDLKGT